MQGEFSFAVRNMSRTRLAPTPTNIWMNSEPLIEKNGTPASPAVARASRVLPVPGGPISKTPLGICAPSFANRAGLFRNSTTSCNSSLACSMPATSAKVFCCSAGRNRFAGLRMKLLTIDPVPMGSPLRRNTIQISPSIRPKPSRLTSRFTPSAQLVRSESNFTPFAESSSISCRSSTGGSTVVNTSCRALLVLAFTGGTFHCPVRRSCVNFNSLMLSFFSSALKSL